MENQRVRKKYIRSGANVKHTRILFENRRFDPIAFIESGPPVLKTLLDVLPCAIALWPLNHLFCVLNHSARELLCLTDRDLRKDPLLWMNRIDPRDRNLFSVAWKKLKGGEKKVSCDYRFFSNEDRKHIWIRDVSVSHQSPHGEVIGVTSVYTDISDIKIRRRKRWDEERAAKSVKVIDNLVHEIQNSLQGVILGLDFLQLQRGEKPEDEIFVRCFQRTNKLINDLRDYSLTRLR